MLFTPFLYLLPNIISLITNYCTRVSCSEDVWYKSVSPRKKILLSRIKLCLKHISIFASKSPFIIVFYSPEMVDSHFRHIKFLQHFLNNCLSLSITSGNDFLYLTVTFCKKRVLNKTQKHYFHLCNIVLKVLSFSRWTAHDFVNNRLSFDQ